MSLQHRPFSAYANPEGDTIDITLWQRTSRGLFVGCTNGFWARHPIHTTHTDD